MLLLLFADLCFSLVLMLRLSCCWVFRLVALPIARDESVNLPSLGCEKFALGQLLVPEAHHIQGARIVVVGFATSLSALLTGFALT